MPAKRLINWRQRLTAPALARAYYEALEMADREGAFESCHVWEGRRPKCVPLVGPQLCSTIGCINPRHWANQSMLRDDGNSKRRSKMSILPPPTVEELHQLVDYYADKFPQLDRNFEALRAVIPPEDLSDKDLTRVLLMELPT